MELYNIEKEPLLQIAERMKDFSHVDFPKKRLEVATLCLNVYEAMEKVFREQGIKVELDITDGFGCFIFENEILLNISLKTLVYGFLEHLNGQEKMTLGVSKHKGAVDILFCASLSENGRSICWNQHPGTDTLTDRAVESVKGYLELEGVHCLAFCEGQTASVGIRLEESRMEG